MIKLPIQRKIDINQLMHSLNLDDDWLLRAFPIDKDGTISLLFAHINNDEDFRYQERPRNEHRYVVVVQTLDGHCTTSFSFNFKDLALVKFELLPNGYYIVTRDSDWQFFVELYDTNTQVHSKFSIGYNVNRVAINSNCEFAVGYYETTNTPAITVYNSDGRIIWSHNNELAKGCLDITVDTDDNFCFICKPENKLYRILGDNYIWIEAFDVPFANCVGFTAETDSTHLENPPNCLFVDNVANLVYWHDGELYSCVVEDNNTDLGISSFSADIFAFYHEDHLIILGSAKDIDIKNTVSPTVIDPAEVIGFPKSNDILEHLQTADKLSTAFRHVNSPNISYVGRGKEIELVYGHIDEEGNLSSWEHHFNSEHYNKLKVVRRDDDYSFYAAIWSSDVTESNNPVPIRLTTLVPKGRLYSVTSNPRRYIEPGEVYEVQIACYQASKLNFYSANSGMVLAPESIISYEAMNKGLEPYAVITGQVQDIQKKFNPYTGIPFTHLTVKCMDLILDILVENSEEIKYVKTRNYVQGTFKLSAKIK